MSTTRARYLRGLESRLTESLNRQAAKAGAEQTFSVEADHLENLTIKYGGNPKLLYLVPEMVEIMLEPGREADVEYFASRFYDAGVG